MPISSESVGLSAYESEVQDMSQCPVKSSLSWIWSLQAVEMLYLVAASALLASAFRLRYAGKLAIPHDLVVIRMLTYASIVASSSALFFQMGGQSLLMMIAVLLYQCFVELAFVYFTVVVLTSALKAAMARNVALLPVMRNIGVAFTVIVKVILMCWQFHAARMGHRTGDDYKIFQKSTNLIFWIAISAASLYGCISVYLTVRRHQTNMRKFDTKSDSFRMVLHKLIVLTVLMVAHFIFYGIQMGWDFFTTLICPVPTYCTFVFLTCPRQWSLLLLPFMKWFVLLYHTNVPRPRKSKTISDVELNSGPASSKPSNCVVSLGNGREGEL
eukprot:223902_1